MNASCVGYICQFVPIIASVASNVVSLIVYSYQVLGKLYSVLSDKDQRAVYDEQGVVDEENDMLSQDRCWGDYWRVLFPKVTQCFTKTVSI